MIMSFIITWQNDGKLLTFLFVKWCNDNCLISRFLVAYSLHFLRLIINETSGCSFFIFSLWFRLDDLHFYIYTDGGRCTHLSDLRDLSDPIITLCSVSFVRFRRAFTLFLREPCGKSQPHVHKSINHRTDVNLTAKNSSSKKKEAAPLTCFILRDRNWSSMYHWYNFFKGSLLSSW